MLNVIELPWVVGIIFTVAETLGLISAADAIMKNQTSQGAIAWAVSLVAFPYLAVPVYWIFGRNKFQGYVKLRLAKNQETSHLIKDIESKVLENEIVADVPYERGRALANLAEMPFTCGNSVELLVNGHATFASIFKGIDSAKAYILVQFYIIQDDELGRTLQSKLIRKAAEGVRVYFLYDEIGCHRLPDAYIEALKNAGINTSAFHTTKGRTNKFQLNFRNHRKVVVIDGRAAYVGGHNVGDEYVGKQKRFGNWRDTHVRVTGPSVQCVQYGFIEDWHWATGTIPRLNWVPQVAENEDRISQVVLSGPADQLETCGLMFVHAFNSAQKRVWIASPYFVPDRQIIGALQLAALRGVDVRILIPEKPDHLLVYLAAFSYFDQTLPFDIKIYRYQAGFMHQKVMLVDDVVSTVGTANLDNRSFRLNFEITMLFYDEVFAGEIERMLEDDFSNSRRVFMADIEGRSILFKVLVRFSRLLSPIL